MIAAALGTAWVGLALVAASRARPRPARVRRLVAEPVPAVAHAHEPVVVRVGRLVHRLPMLRRRPEPDVLAARRWGTAVVAAAPVAVVLPIAAPAAAVVGWCLPGVRLRREERRRQARVAASLPEVVDLLVLAVEAGLTVHLAVAAVAKRAAGPLAKELTRVMDEVAMGRRLADALDDVPARAGEPVRPLVAALVASDRYGAPLGAGLARLADDIRGQRRRRAEEAARRVPVKLLFPLVTCVLPAFGLLTVAPLVASAVRSLRL